MSTKRMQTVDTTHQKFLGSHPLFFVVLSIAVCYRDEMFFILLADGSPWRYRDAARPAVFATYMHAANVLRMLGLIGAEIVYQLAG